MHIICVYFFIVIDELTSYCIIISNQGLDREKRERDKISNFKRDSAIDRQTITFIRIYPYWLCLHFIMIG